ncbi:MAG: ferritin-like domain-containing protein [Solirubrobacteraceae bacterium]|nr:ferritin-like domain-containing protein [Patulibacter sp.]
MSQHTPAVDVSHLAVLDTDGALREAADRVNNSSRRGFLRGTGLVVGGAALSGLIPGSAFAASSGDVAILNFALTLEYLESTFYAQAKKHAGLTGEFKRFAWTVHDHEAAHVGALQKALGKSAVKRPTFDFGAAVQSQAAFGATAVVLEDTGVQAYQGQAPNISSNAIFEAAISIHPVEARHAAWIRNLTGLNPAPFVVNPALSKDQVLAAVTGTGFIKG